MNVRPATPATELLPLPATGRRFVASRGVRLSDVDVAGRVRFDSIARYLQDVAGDDARDVGLPNAAGWVVRRTLIRVDRPCVLDEAVELTTFCTGAGRSWAERRTSLVGANGGAIEAVSLWVQIDVTSGRPTRLADEFFEAYGAASAGRSVSSKLSLPPPGADVASTPWRFRRTDLDPFDHVNNAAQWVVLESAVDLGDGRGTAELEYLAPAGLGELALRVDGSSAWLVDAGRVISAFRWSATAASR